MQAPDPQARAIAIFGATSDIAAAVARNYGEAGWRIVLVGRDADAMATAQSDLMVRGASAVIVQTADFVQLATLPHIAQAAWAAFGGLDIAFLAYGTLPDQAAGEADAAIAEAALVANFTSPVVLLNEIARHFVTTSRRGVIAAITSVAGDRGRMSNHIYGAAKGGLQRYLQGLRHRLHRAGVAVLDIRPGFVSTKMTAHVPQSGPLWATPEKVAADIQKAITARSAVLYTPWFWQAVMLIIRSVPRAVFHRTKL
jgi:short-subunit dehydrogenase